jgi:hypothetical protein
MSSSSHKNTDETKYISETNMIPSQQKLVFAAAVLLWLLPRPVHTFAHPLVILNPHIITPGVDTKRAKRAHSWQSIDTALQILKSEAGLRREKVTKEVTELLDVMYAREKGSGPELLVAQVAPCVRYVRCMMSHNLEVSRSLT